MPRDRILILGGTRDARELAAELVAGGRNVVTSLAGVTTQPERPEGDVRVGGFGGAEGLANYLDAEDIAVVIDCTHPFASRISANAYAACAARGVLLLRLERPAWKPGFDDRWNMVSSASEAAARLPSGARVLLTTGRKDLEPFFARADVSGIARMIEEPPLDPPPQWRVLRERPPFTVAGEAALMAENGITHLVTKNAGGSATEAKLQAARELRIPVVMIARPVKPEVPVFAAIGNLMVVVEGVLSP